MKKRFAYFYFMKNDPDKIAKTVTLHINYWKESDTDDYLGGPFSDRSGGLISFTANSIEEATNTILKDPFILEDLLSERWIKEWRVE